MKSLKTFLLGTTLTAAFGILFGTSALADTLYTVQPGDTLSKISVDLVGNQSLVNSIVKDNKIKNANLIHVGQQLTINSDKVENTSTEVTYTEPVYTESTYTEPTYQEETVVYEAPAAQETATYSGNGSSAKEWIAQKESSGSYNATNGQYIGRYQLSSSYLNGDYSPENQERVADQYVADRYGSWENAQSFWMSNGWY